MEFGRREWSLGGWMKGLEERGAGKTKGRRGAISGFGSTGIESTLMFEIPGDHYVSSL